MSQHLIQHNTIGGAWEVEVQPKVFNFSIWLRTAPLVGSCECSNKQYITNSVLTGEVNASFPPYGASNHVTSMYISMHTHFYRRSSIPSISCLIPTN